MPRVPYAPYPTVEPTTAGTPSLRIDTPGAAFGANIGQSLEGLGLSLERDSDKIFNRAVALQELQNETAARNADIAASTQMGKLHAEFSSLEGVNAGPKALEKYSADLNDVYQKIRSGLPNDDARRRYDSAALSVLNRSIFNGAGHSAQQMKLAAEGSAKAQVASAADDLYHNPTEQGLDSYLDKATSAANTVADLRGMDPIARKELQNKYTSHELSHLITGLAKREPWKAGELLERYRDRIHGDDIERVENSVQGAQRTVGARNISMQVNADLHDPDMEDHRGLEDRIADGREKAKELAPKDELLPAYVDAFITAEYNRWKQVQRDTEFSNKQTIEGALLGNFSEGKIPQNVDELRATPAVDSAWSSLKPSTQRHYLNVLSDVVRRGERVDPYSSLQERQKYVGMAQTEPNAFLEEDVLANKKLSVPDMKYLVGLKNQIIKQAGQDPSLTKALQVMSPDLNSAGISRTTDKDQYFKFVGALQDQLADYRTEHKRTPKAEEILQIGRRLLQEQAVPGRFFGDRWPSHIKTFELAPPQETIDAIKDDIRSRDPTMNPTDEQITREYIRQKYRRLFDQPAPTGTEPEGGPQK
jgi:hypothetical protein